MKQLYKSEIINNILEQRGHEKSSLHYQSECAETWIEENKGSYPKLCDYESEWLCYINEKPIGEFPYETITNVTDASVNNVVPFAYQSAILKGNTLVNLCDKTKSVFSAGGNKNLWQNVLFNTNPTQLTVINHTDKVIKFGVNNRTTDDWVSTNRVEANSKSLVNCGTNNYLKDIYGAYSDGWSNTEEDRNILKDGVLILEGDHTQEDIPYFEGMQSVKMPVLTTTGKNLFDISKEQKNITINVDNGNSDIETNDRNTSDFIKVIPNTNYKCNVIMTRLAYYDKNKQFITLNTSVSQPFTIPTSCNFVKFSYDNALTNIQFEQGSITTSYEPYKSNILTVNEDLTLRGIGDVKDTLDCLTGEVTERIGEIVIDGSDDEQWFQSSPRGDSIISFQLQINGKQNSRNFTNDKMPNKTRWDEPTESLWADSSIILTFNKSSLTTADVYGVRQRLSQNPITIQYELATESIKTVDLIVIDQDGKTLRQIKPLEGIMHISTDGTPLKPTVSMEIPVEAITQNLASFIEEE